MFRKYLNYFCIALLFLLCSSCSVVKFAKIYSSADNVESSGVLHHNVYKTDKTTYRIGSLGPGWKRIKSDRGDLFFWNKSKQSTITVDSICDKVKIKYDLTALSDSLITGIKDKKLLKRDNITLSGIDALYSQYEGIFEDENIGISTIVLKKGICIYDLSYSSLAKEFNNNLDEFLDFSADFEVVVANNE